MIENAKVKFDQKKHYENVHVSNLETQHDFTKTLVVGEKGKSHFTPNAQNSDLKNVMAITKNIKSGMNEYSGITGCEKKPFRRVLSMSPSLEYVPAGRKHIVPQCEQHKTVETVFDNGGKEPKIGNFPTNLSRYMKGKELDSVIDQINRPTTPPGIGDSKYFTTSKIFSSTSKALSSTQLSAASLESTNKEPESNKDSTVVKTNNNSKRNSNNESNNVNKMDLWKLEDLRQIRSLTKKVGKAPSWEEKNGIFATVADDDF